MPGARTQADSVTLAAMASSKRMQRGWAVSDRSGVGFVISYP
ncbi:hypothetical protein C7S15_7092 [Burkholderia cepacia]|nr:hypothetical protein [Burkholderia cepacia]